MVEFIGELIGFLIVGIPLGFALWHQLYNDRQRSNEQIAKKIQNYISFDESTSTLSVYDFHPLIYRVVTMDRYEILHTAYQPETYTYTSVRVGNVTIGDVSKNEAYKYISGSSKTDKYELNYLRKYIRKIKLCSQELIDKARRAGLEKYMNSEGEIIVVGRASVSQDALKSALSGYYAQMQIEGLDAQPSYDKCSRILSFLNSAKGQPVPKEKKTPAQVAALKKTLVGLLVFFLVMGGIFVMLIPSMLEDEIVRGLSRTYMQLDPKFFDGAKYTLEVDYERNRDEQTLIFNGSEYYVYVKKETWTKVELTGGDLRYLPFTDPLTLKYKWKDGEAVATKLLDSEGNVLWSIHPEDRYNSAVALMDAGQYLDAIVIFRSLGDYEDSAQKLAECEHLERSVLDGKYADAVALMEAGKYEDAASAFVTLGDYKDSAKMVEEARNTAKYAAAENLLTEGKISEAAVSFYKIANYKDAWDRSFALWNDITKHETISAGFTHTVGLCNDGTVVAVGDNSCGECDVSGWKDIVAVSAGSNHTVGLRSNGTVVAVGNNEYDQCNISNWTDIAAVSTSNVHTVGLRMDGTVVATGSNRYGQCDVNDWTNIVAVSAGDFHTVGLRSDGTVVAAGSNNDGQCIVSAWTDIVAVSAGGDHTLGLRSDGTVRAVGDDHEGSCKSVGGLVAVSAGEWYTVGLCSDGAVIAVGWDKYGQCNVGNWKNIVAINAGDYHTVGLCSDGTVVAVGDNEHGQCNVSDWKDIKLP